jgi:NAD(P)-dependent dehydrogenase (short-subunit alcohol dehydrogenase family)
MSTSSGNGGEHRGCAQRLFDVQGKNVVVTGGSRGIGREIVLGLASAGANVVVASRKVDECDEVARLARGFGVMAVAADCHVGRWDDCERLVERAYSELGPLDLLVNNAGMAATTPRMVDITERLFDATVAVNLKGPLRLSCLVGSRMKAAGGGSIVNISSTAAVHPNPAAAVYGAAKAALNSLTLALAVEYGPEVRVNAIGLGPARSDATRAWIDGERFVDAARRGAALRRGGEPCEVIGTVLYLASDASSFTTGAVVQVDGGVYGDVLTATGGPG